MFELPSSAHVVLDHLLAALDIGVTHFTVCGVRDGWGMRFDACKTASLHYCLAGAGILAAHGALPIQLEPHTFVLLPPEGAYRIESVSKKSVRLEYRARLCGVSSHESVPTLTVGEGQQGIATACGELRVGLASRLDFYSGRCREDRRHEPFSVCRRIPARLWSIADEFGQASAAAPRN
jgi:hypothetical protein